MLDDVYPWVVGSVVTYLSVIVLLNVRVLLMVSSLVCDDDDACVEVRMMIRRYCLSSN